MRNPPLGFRWGIRKGNLLPQAKIQRRRLKLNWMKTISLEFEETPPLGHEPAKKEIPKTLVSGCWPTSLTQALLS